uniref:Uncharacterized protein n=1 Tax=Parascaris univalens TaxID=6257 RepID=A0A915C3P3_PARUN
MSAETSIMNFLEGSYARENRTQLSLGAGTFGVMQLVVAILLTEIVICSPDTDVQVNHEMEHIDGGQEKGGWLKTLRSRARNAFFGHYGGGEGNNYGGSNIGSVYVVNLKFSIG